VGEIEMDYISEILQNEEIRLIDSLGAARGRKDAAEKIIAEESAVILELSDKINLLKEAIDKRRIK
jgi:hypothetical protein